MNCIKILRYTSNLYQLFWVFILWAPFIYKLYTIGSISQLYKQLTWWSWTIQCFFYTYMHCKQSFFYKKLRVKCNVPILNYLPNDTEMYLFGSVSGISWFVFFEFIYVLYHNPDIVYNESIQHSNKGIPQISNIFIHYFIITVLPMWIIFNFRYLHSKLKDFTVKKSILFSTIWMVYLFIYLCYWKFNIIGILQNYRIDDVSIGANVSYLILLLFAVTNANAIYLYSIKRDLNIITNNDDKKTAIVYIENGSE